MIKMATMANITGDAYNYMLDGHLITAAFHLYNEAFMYWVVAILFFVYQFMLLLKTRNLTLSWVTGLLFASMYVGAVTIVKPISAQIIFVLLAIELGAILYFLIWK